MRRCRRSPSAALSRSRTTRTSRSAFAGIAKALATWTWFGNVRGVFLTVAGENGTTLEQRRSHRHRSDRGDSGSAAIRMSRCRSRPTCRVLFTFSAGVAVDQADYDPDQVLAQVWQNVSAAFAFDQRQLGQSVVASEIIEIIQQTAGRHRGAAAGAGPQRGRGRRAGSRAAVRRRPGPAAGRPDAAARSAPRAALELWS